MKYLILLFLAGCSTMKPYSCNALLFLDEDGKSVMHVNYFTINATSSPAAYAKRDELYPNNAGLCEYLEAK